jgi:hypothetical protein
MNSGPSSSQMVFGQPFANQFEGIDDIGAAE